ncbi:hypothetical protein AVEN_284-1 [Araneus ventricosus]|uniref:Uncharacterized protein n=1 Tax=Araneus ventricosus TaxID=182803 RepID=A0A4Y2CPH8_ARAVE|nr:hypothetical protein AVEN_284-1 [Araneus ventricosus]
MAWPNLKVRACGLWNSNSRAPFLRRIALQISRQRSNERMHCRRLVTTSSFDVRAIYRHNAGNNRCTYKPTSHFDSSCSDDRKQHEQALGTQLSKWDFL